MCSFEEIKRMKIYIFVWMKYVHMYDNVVNHESRL